MKHNRAPSSEHGLGDRRDLLTEEEKLQAVRMIGLEMYKGHGKNGLELADGGSVGSRDSAHDVFFARAEPVKGLGLADAVVIKRFRRPESAKTEADNLAEIARRGLRTVVPTGPGLYSLGDLGTALVTDFVPKLTTMNRIGWGDFSVGHPNYANLSSTLEEIGAFAGQLHGAGVFHNDLQVKNVGMAPLIRPGQPTVITPVVFDVEGARFFDPNISADSSEGLEFAGRCAEDLNKLVGSLVDKRFLVGARDKVFEQEIADHLLAPYFDNGGNPALLDQYDSIVGEALRARHSSPRLSPAEVGRLALT